MTIGTELSDFFNDCEIAGPASEESIRKAETALGVRFPPSYRQFLARFGAVECDGFFIAGLSNQIEGEAPFWVDVVTSTNQLRSAGDFPHQFIAISDDGAELKFFLKTDEHTQNHENPVVALGPSVGEKRVADNFNEFVLLCVQDALPV